MSDSVSILHYHDLLVSKNTELMNKMGIFEFILCLLECIRGKQDSSATRHFGTVEKDSSAPRKFGIRTNRHRIFFQTNVITFFKIKSTKVKKKHQSAIKLKEKFSQGFI